MTDADDIDLSKIQPHYPEWAKPGCKVIKTWEREIRSGTARGVGTFVEYKNSKGKVRECMKWVKWKN